MVQTAERIELVFRGMECLSDPTRLRLLRILERHELGVVELCEVLQLPQSTVSRHLKILLDQSWLISRRQGTAHLYRMLLDELSPASRKLWLLAREQTEEWATWRQDSLRLSRRLRDKQDGGQAFFASAAGQWDKLRGELYGHGFTAAALAALLPSDAVIADLGCGTGQIAALLAPHVRRVIGVDHSAAMLKAARRRLRDVENVDLRQGDLLALPIEDGTCDAALMILALTYVDDLAGAIRDVARILKPGGKAVMVDLLPHDRDDFRRQMGQAATGIDPTKMEPFWREARFEPVLVQSIAPEPEAKGPALFITTARLHSEAEWNRVAS